MRPDGPIIYGARSRDRSVAQPGRALSSGGRGRWFESTHSDQHSSFPAITTGCRTRGSLRAAFRVAAWQVWTVSEAPASLNDLGRRLENVGMVLLGTFAPSPGDGVPSLSHEPVRTVAVIGNAGPALWRAFAAARTAADPDTIERDPLDRWTRRVLDPIALEFGADVLYPFGGPPWHPFQRWAKRTGTLFQSPIGMLIHPDHGLWVALRGAFAFAEDLADAPPASATASPCATCADRPCLSTCPVGAFAGASVETPRYDVTGCQDHLATVAGADCRELGCRARRACPVARAAVWPPAQAAFHMAAFQRPADRRRR